MELVALGDSLTQGYGLNPEDGLVPQLQAWLRAQGADVTVINAGVSGDTTEGGKERLDWSLDDKTSAVMVELGANDFLRGRPPAMTHANLDEILGEITSRRLPVLLIGVRVPGNYGPDYQARFDAIWPDLASKYKVMMVPNFFAPISALPPEEVAARGLMQPDGLHPAPEGVKLIVEALGPKLLDLLAQAKG